MSSLQHRRKSGPKEVGGGKKTINVRYEGQEHAVSWFAGASDESITRTIEIALGLPRDTPAVIRDPEDSSALAVSDSLPHGLTVDAAPAERPWAIAAAVQGAGGEGDGTTKWNGSSNSSRQGSSGKGSQKFQDGFYGGNENAAADGGHCQPSETKRLLDAGHGGGRGSIGRSGGDGGGDDAGDDEGRGAAAQEFRGEMLKFERVNAHLANERTWLAWVRTALSVLGVALSLISLANDMGSATMDTSALVLGVAFVLCTLLTYATGWLRYARVKQVLSWTGSQIKGSFGRFGLQYFTWFLGVALVLTVPIYLIAGVNVVEEA